MDSDYPIFQASASRDRSLDWRRRLQVIAYAAALGVCVQCYNRGVTRVLKAIRRGITAAVAAYIEDRGGMKLFTLEDDLDDGHPHALRTPFARYAARYARSGLKSGGASPHGEEHSPTSPLAGPDSSDSGSGVIDDLPNFFESTKFFSCLEAEDVRGLYAGTGRVTLGPHEPLFNAGDPSESGIFIVVEGRLGTYLPAPEPRGGGADPSTDRLLVNVLVYGESVGDLDVLDGAPRAASAAALAEGCTLVQVPRDLFLNFILARPATLLVYLQKAMARLWRVSHFVLSDFLQLPLEDFKGLEMDGVLPGLPPLRTGQAAEEGGSGASAPSSPGSATASGAEDGSSAPGSPAAAPRRQGILKDKGAAAPPGTAAVECPTSRRVVTMGRRRVSFHSEQASPFREAMAGATAGLARAAAAAAALPGDTACLKEGWDVVAPHETGIREASWEQLAAGLGRRRVVAPMEQLHDQDALVHAFYVVLEGTLVATRVREGQEPRTASVLPGSLVSCAAFLSSTRTKCEFAAGGEPCLLAGFGARELNSLLYDDSDSLANLASPQPSGVWSPCFGASPSGQSPVDGPCGVDPAAALLRSRGARSLARQSHTSNLAPLERAGSALAGTAGAAGMPGTDVAEGPKARPAVPASPLRPGAAASRPDAVDEPAAAPAAQSRRNASGLLREALEGRGAAPPAPADDNPTGGEADAGQDCRPERRGPGVGSPEAREPPPPTDAPAPLSSTLKSAVYIDLLLGAARALGPVVRQFTSLGLNRVWLHAGDVVYRQGDVAECMYVVISGRARLLHRASRGREVGVEDDVGRGESMGAVWALAGGRHDTSAICIRDAELCRLTRGSFELLCALHPRAAARVLQGMAERLAASQSNRGRGGVAGVQRETLDATSLGETTVWKKGGNRRRGEIVTIAVLPAGRVSGGASAMDPVTRLATELRGTLELMWGPTLLLDAASIAAAFPTTHARLKSSFHRSKVCSWMAAQEEEFRFIILVGDGRDSPWSRICASQADCTLLVADPACTAPQVSTQEQALVWQSISRAASLVTRSSTLPDLLADAAWKLLGQEGLNSLLGEGAAQGGGSPSGTAGAASLSLSALMRVELVLVHAMDGVPSGTAAWLDARPLLTRHHHIRLGFEPDMARLSRWMADRAVGVVLSGGGSRGLAHQGVLNALADAGVPIDVVGGTSQGAFMGGLYAQNLRRSAMEDAVRRYATEMGSVRKLLMDLTLPIISVFNGAGFDRVVREALGLQRIEDLWLRFFCVSTNLSRGAPSVHERGLLWKMCRASMTIVGLVPPVFHAGDLLVDGGYLNNIPVDVMHGLGVGTVIVVDVEDRDQSAWHNLTPYDGGVSGWQLLWDRWCPVEAWRYNVRIPRYSQLMNSLTWMSHQQTLRRVSQEYVIDLYLRPPVFHYRLMDYYLAERIVREASQYAWVVVSEWQAKIGIHRTGLAGLLHADSAGFPRTPSSLTLVDRSRSSACMTQLQGKQRGRVAFGPRNASLELPRGLSKSLEEQPAHLLGPLGPDTLHTYQSLPLALQGRGGRRRARRADAVQGSGSVAGFATMPPPATDHLPTLSRMAGKRGGAEEGGEGAWGADPEGEILFPISDVGEEFGSPGASLGSGA
ncbi:hypothetical protein ACKKBG_A18025 [Auxenochlorella protothecoides x Auxenochlorella symbiontica]